MNTIILSLPGNEELSSIIASKLDAPIGRTTIRRFPDGESYIRIHDEVKGKKVVIVCTLHQPNEKLLSLYFLARIAKEQGAKCTCLVAPYLAYMRQDKIFNKGEGLTSKYFSSLVSQFADSIITVDPHLHRIQKLDDIYTVQTEVVHAANHISSWISGNISNPVLVGPDSESEQWVSEVAKNAGVPFMVLEKIRHGDRKVEVSVPDVTLFNDHTPLLIDDIISTARTMIQTVEHLKNAGMKPPVCIGVHAVFADRAYQDLLDSGVEKVITCNTIPHITNAIDLSDLYLDFIRQFNFLKI